MGTTNTDRIEEKVLIRAPRARVWQALSDSGEFGQWFGVQGLGAFTPGATVLAVSRQGRLGGRTTMQMRNWMDLQGYS